MLIKCDCDVVYPLHMKLSQTLSNNNRKMWFENKIVASRVKRGWNAYYSFHFILFCFCPYRFLLDFFCSLKQKLFLLVCLLLFSFFYYYFDFFKHLFIVFMLICWINKKCGPLLLPNCNQAYWKKKKSNGKRTKKVNFNQTVGVRSGDQLSNVKRSTAKVK